MWLRLWRTDSELVDTGSSKSTSERESIMQATQVDFPTPAVRIQTRSWLMQIDRNPPLKGSLFWKLYMLIGQLPERLLLGRLK